MSCIVKIVIKYNGVLSKLIIFQPLCHWTSFKIEQLMQHDFKISRIFVKLKYHGLTWDLSSCVVYSHLTLGSWKTVFVTKVARTWRSQSLWISQLCDIFLNANITCCSKMHSGLRLYHCCVPGRWGCQQKPPQPTQERCPAKNSSLSTNEGSSLLWTLFARPLGVHVSEHILYIYMYRDSLAQNNMLP